VEAKNETFFVLIEWKEGWLSQTHWRSANCACVTEALDDLNEKIKADMIVDELDSDAGKSRLLPGLDLHDTNRHKE